jgi:hypothetical protein
MGIYYCTLYPLKYVISLNNSKCLIQVVQMSKFIST